MTDFPTMNNNVHAMALLGALRVAGIEARAHGLAVQPHVPDHRLALRTELVDLDVAPDHLRLVWRATPGVPRTLAIAAPRGKRLTGLVVDGAPVVLDAPVSVTPTAQGVVADATFGD